MESREAEAHTALIYPITFTDHGKVQGIPTPLVRITTCGMLTLEVLKEVVSVDPPRGRYEIVPTQTLRGRGAIPSLTLLKLLIGCPHRFATTDWLATQMQHEMEAGALIRLDTIASYLRGLLCKIEDEQHRIDTLRLLLVEYLRNGRGSGPGYRLATYPFIWLDTDALTSHVEHGALMERMGDPALSFPFWERAYQLASRGIYLPDEPSSDWARERRELVSGHLRQSVHALHRLYLAEHDQAGEEEAIRMLRTYWLSHKTDEDALRPLMELLGQRECFGEAETYYQQCVLSLEQEEHGRQPDKRTQDIWDFLHTKQIRRDPKSEEKNELLLSASFSSDQQESPSRPIISSTTGYPVSNKHTLALPNTVISQSNLFETLILDCATKFGLLLAQTMTLIEKWYGMAKFCSHLQNQLDLSIRALHSLKTQYTPGEYVTSRRSFLITLAAMPTALLSTSKQTYTTVLNLEELLPQCAASITACWHLSGGNHLDSIAPIIDSYLPTLIALVKNIPPYREVAANLVAQCYFLKAILAWHVKGLDTAESYCIQAQKYGDIANNANLLLTALNQHALIAYYGKQFQKALAKSEEADLTLKHTPHERIFPIVQGRVYMYLAAIQAQQTKGSGQHTLGLAQKAFALQATTDEPIPLYADCGEAPLTLWEGLTHYHLSFRESGHEEHALSALRTFGQLQQNTNIPERFRLECLTNRTLAAIQCNDMEEAVDCLKAAKQGAGQLESRQRASEVEYAYQTMLRQWPGERNIQKLNA